MKKQPTDITYNPYSRRAIPGSTRSITAAKRIASSGGQKSYANHRESDVESVKGRVKSALKRVMGK